MRNKNLILVCILVSLIIVFVACSKSPKQVSPEEARKILSQMGINSSNSKVAFMGFAGEHSLESYTVIYLLLTAGMNPNTKDDFGWTALMYAAGTTNIQTIKLLVDKGADVNAKNIVGLTALMVASREGHTDIVQLLLKNGADVNAKANNGETALSLASKNSYLDIMQLLKNSGAKK